MAQFGLYVAHTLILMVPTQLREQFCPQNHDPEVVAVDSDLELLTELDHRLERIHRLVAMAGFDWVVVEAWELAVDDTAAEIVVVGVVVVAEVVGGKFETAIVVVFAGELCTVQDHEVVFEVLEVAV